LEINHKPVSGFTHHSSPKLLVKEAFILFIYCAGQKKEVI